MTTWCYDSSVLSSAPTMPLFWASLASASLAKSVSHNNKMAVINFANLTSLIAARANYNLPTARITAIWPIVCWLKGGNVQWHRSPEQLLLSGESISLYYCFYIFFKWGDIGTWKCTLVDLWDAMLENLIGYNTKPNIFYRCSCQCTYSMKCLMCTVRERKCLIIAERLLILEWDCVLTSD